MLHLLLFSTLCCFREDSLISVPSDFSSYPGPAFCFHPAQALALPSRRKWTAPSAVPLQTTCQPLLMPLPGFVLCLVPMACVPRSVAMWSSPLWLPVVLSIEVISHNVCSYNYFEFKVSCISFPKDQTVLVKNSY